MKITMKKNELINLLKEEYDKRLDVFSNLEEVTVTNDDDKVVLSPGTKLYDAAGNLWTIVNGEWILNKKGERCLTLAKESLKESDRAVKSKQKTIHPRKNKKKKSLEYDVNADVQSLEDAHLGNNEYLIPEEDLERMFTL